MSRALATLLASLWLLAPGVRAAADSSVARHAEPGLSADELLGAQPGEIVQRLHEEKLVMMQEVREAGSLSGGLLVALVLFEQPAEVAYRHLSQTARQVEYRPEVTAIETVAVHEAGPVDVHHIRVLFRRFQYRLKYSLDAEARQIRWDLDADFDNDLRHVSGFWELYPMGEQRTLARFGTSIDVGPAVPAFLQDWITRKNIPGSMERARRWVDSKGTYRP